MSIRPCSEAALDGQADREAEARSLHAAQVVAGLIRASCWLREPQRQPTREQCCTGLLDVLALKSRGWLSSWAGRSVLQRHGLTEAQVEAWREQHG